MTIDECLEIACKRLEQADRLGDGECAAIAQAAAQTVQAMIWRNLTKWTDGLPGAVLPVTRFDI